MREKLLEALQSAMAAGDQRRTRTLRLVLAAIRDREQCCAGTDGHRAGSARPGDDGGIIEVLTTMVRQRRRSMKALEEAGQLELVEQEANEIATILEFLPRQLDNGEMYTAIRQTIADIGATGIKDLGRTMAALRARYAGQMDFAKASALVKELL